MTPQGPWLDSWDIESPLGKGGQGSTFNVKRKTDGQNGVLKILKHQDNEEARRRMHREVTNLKTLHGAGCKVPGIIDGNTDHFEKNDIHLYFVMEYIPGQKLCDVVSSKNGLGLEKSISIALDLLSTVKKALVEDVIHRDLKPENILVRNFDQDDLVIVDYGLSFNATKDDNVTRVSETLDNSFFSMPERRVHGGNRRDPRSELTSICALVYYCITTRAPVDLIGPDGRAPHRRIGSSIKEKLGESARTIGLEMFFDRGFSANIDDRFQSIPEITSRLEEVLKPAAQQTKEDPAIIATRVGKLLLKNNRNVQIEEYKKIALQLPHALNTALTSLSAILPFSISTLHVGFAGLSPVEKNIPSAESVLNEWCARLVVRENPKKITFLYSLVVKGNQCGVFRKVFKHTEMASVPGITVPKTLIHDWECVFWYDALVAPNWSLVLGDFKACVVEGMKAIEQDIISTHN